MNQTLVALLRPIGSHGVTLVLLGAVALVVVAGLVAGVPVADWIALPLAGLFVNLAAALAAHGTLRAQPMLFAFHAMLAVLVLLVGADRLTALRGHVEVTEGAMFDPALAELDAGPLHPWALDKVSFVQGGFEIRYAPGMKRRETVSQLRIPDAAGQWHEATVGDDDPLIVGNYRFYTSFNKGFAPVLTYTATSGASATGAVHMPSYPLRDFDQGNDWTPPGGAPLKLWLSISEPVYKPDEAWVFRKPEDPVLVVVEGDQRHELALGQATALAGGAAIRFEGLRTWMGYTITANLFNAWMVAIAVAAGLALVVHRWTRFAPAAAGAGSEVRHAE